MFSLLYSDIEINVFNFLFEYWGVLDLFIVNENLQHKILKIVFNTFNNLNKL